MTEIICGVDVSSDALDARIGRDGAETRIAATPEGVAALAAFCREQLAARAAQVGKTLEDLAAWRPAPAARGRRARSTT